MIEIRFWYGKDHFEEPYSVREAVFIQEQGFQNEIDEWDDHCWHCVAYDQEKPVGCGRFFSENPREVTIGRIAVLPAYRGLKLGKKLVESIEQKACELGFQKAGLSAQCQAQGFYERLGYQAEGEVYLDEHCPHIHMTKSLL